MEQVKLVSLTRDALHLTAHAARRCKNSFELSDTPSIRDQKPEAFGEDKVGPKDIELVKKCIEAGHESIMEHVNITVELDFSRVAHTQMVRHRLASFSAESQRAVESKTPCFFVPNTLSSATEIAENASGQKAIDVYWDSLASSFETYRRLIHQYGVKPEDARYVLPMALVQPMVMTANLREWRHILRERTCKDAQYEIRRAAKMVRTLIGAIHDIFTYDTTYYDTCGKGPECGLCLVNWEGIEHDPVKELKI